MEEQQVAQSTVLTLPSSVKGLIEALIFAADEPLTPKQIKSIYDSPGLDGEARSIAVEEIEAIIEELNREFQAAGKAYRIIRIAGGYQFATLPEYAGWLGKLYREQSRRKLSQSSLETLAIIAYKQPITKPEIESIRGVNCDYVLKTLLEKELVTVVGRAETVGRPLLYGTTKEFLKHFGLNDVTDLPRPREIEEILGESQFETERRMLEAQAGAEKMKKEEEDFKSRLPHIPKKKPDLNEPVEIIPRRRSGELRLRKSKPPVGEPQFPFPAGQQQQSEPQPGDTVSELVEDVGGSEGVLPPTAGSKATEEQNVSVVPQMEDPAANVASQEAQKTRPEVALAEDNVGNALAPAVPAEPTVQSAVSGSETQTYGVEGAETDAKPDLPTAGSDESEEKKQLAISAPPVEDLVESHAGEEPVEPAELPVEPAPSEILPAGKEELKHSTNDEPVTDTAPPAERGRAGRLTRWQQLKEKIQGFIKKLFA